LAARVLWRALKENKEDCKETRCSSTCCSNYTDVLALVNHWHDLDEQTKAGTLKFTMRSLACNYINVLLSIQTPWRPQFNPLPPPLPACLGVLNILSTKAYAQMAVLTKQFMESATRKKGGGNSNVGTSRTSTPAAGMGAHSDINSDDIQESDNDGQEVRSISKLFASFACNVHTICDPEQRPIGIGLYVNFRQLRLLFSLSKASYVFSVVRRYPRRGALFNHSCEPNCVQVCSRYQLAL
jgi:hypothetical protein